MRFCCRVDDYLKCVIIFALVAFLIVIPSSAGPIQENISGKDPSTQAEIIAMMVNDTLNIDRTFDFTSSYNGHTYHINISKIWYDNETGTLALKIVDATRDGDTLSIKNPVRFYNIPFEDDGIENPLNVFRIVVLEWLETRPLGDIEAGGPDPTLVVYSTVDGYAMDNTASATYATLRNAVGTSASSSGTTVTAPRLEQTTAGSGRYANLYRGILSFNTSILPDTTTLSAAKVVFQFSAKTNTMVSTPSGYSITGGTLASNSSIAAGDYDGFTQTIYTTNITYAAITTDGTKTNFTFTSGSLSNISLNQSTILFLRDTWDMNTTPPTLEDKAVSCYLTWYADGSANKPWMEIEYTAVTPVASFQQNVTSGFQPETIQFNDTSTNIPTSWSWSFNNVTGNNTWLVFSTSQNPTQVFNFGNFSIRLNATNGAGTNTSTQVSWVNISREPLSSFTMDSTGGVAPVSVGFTDTSERGPTSWSWQFRNITPGNNTWDIFSAIQNPTQIFNYGNFSIRLNATNPGGTNTSTQISWVNVSAPCIPPTSDFSGFIISQGV